VPKTTTLLESRERRFFGKWLDNVRVAQRLTKSDLNRAIGATAGSSTERVGRYLEGRVFPTPYVLLKLSTELDLPPIPTLLRAGYYAPALAAVRKLERLSARLESKRIAIPAPSLLAIRMIVAWFPLRGDNARFSPASDKFAATLYDSTSESARLLAEAEDKVDDLEPRRWPRILRIAHEILNDSKLIAATRRFASAELVHHWARSLSSKVYDDVRNEFIRSQT